jgi:hypothetical protein
LIAGVVRIRKGVAIVPLSHQICCDLPENVLWIYLFLPMPIQRLVIVDASGGHVPFSGSRNEILRNRDKTPDHRVQPFKFRMKAITNAFPEEAPLPVVLCPIIHLFLTSISALAYFFGGALEHVI